MKSSVENRIVGLLYLILSFVAGNYWIRGFFLVAAGLHIIASAVFAYKELKKGG